MFNNLSPHRHLRRPSIDMDFRKFLSRLFKKLKHRLVGGSRGRGGRSGSENNREGGVADVDGSESSQRNSRLHSEVDVEDVMEGGSSRERSDVDGKKVGRSLISHGGKLNSM
jgi:hypothetical protein